MKRYDLEDVGLRGEPDMIMVERDDGEWVRWKDVTTCICEEMYERVKHAYADGSDADWFCPAHGYKKR